jgi:DNA polymerase-3 subunit alpha
MPLQELIPVAVSSKDELTTQYAMSDLEKTGMLKMDFLALTALTVISDCLLSIKRMLNTTINWTDVRLDDEETMSLFSEGRTDAIFQFESSGMQEICRKLRPRSIEDLAALNALYRPGPLDGGMVEDFIERHHGVKSPRYLVPEMREILSNTHGIIVYQEQIMQLAQKLGGYSLGEADLMRRAMGKKNREEMAVHEEKFVTGAIENGIREQQARQIFSLMAQFADYGFNRSHSVAYAYLAFQTAFLKAHYPEHFYAAVLSNESQDSTKLYKYSSELRTNGIKLLPPDINESGSGFTPLTGAIRFGLAALKGVGQTSVDAILQARRKNHFSSLLDLVLRVGTTSLNKRVLESLIAGGALDSVRPENGSIHKYRAELLAAVDSVLSVAAREQRHVQAGQDNLFGDSAVKDSAQTFHFPDVEQLTHEELLAGEKSSIGFYISGHPLDTFSAILAELKVRSIDDLIELPTRSEVCTAGIISGFQVRTTKKGSRFGLFRLEDQTGSIKCVAWPEVFSKNSKHLAETSSVIVNGKLEVTDDGSSSVIVQEVLLLNETLQQRSRLVTITLPKQDPSTDTLNHIFQLIDKYRGDCDILIEVLLEDDVIVQTKPHSALRVKGSLALEDQLAKLGCTFRWSQVRI